MADIPEDTQKPHNCEEHRVYDGGQKINRDGVRIWVETYYCSICRRRLDVKEEVLDRRVALWDGPQPMRILNLNGTPFSRWPPPSSPRPSW